jgi:hypothetical protein
MNHLNELPERDQRLAERLAATLDQAAARPDPALDKALAVARTRARNQDTAPVRQLRPWLWASGMALAAGLALVVMIPGGGPLPASHAPIAKVAPADDPDMLEDLDMLQALSADDNQSNQS